VGRDGTSPEKNLPFRTPRFIAFVFIAPAGTLPNDIDGGVIGQAQYDTWKANFGSTVGSGSASSAPVPEPESGLLLLSAAAIGAWMRRRTAEKNRVGV
jgi:hypothetical protein